MLQSPNHVELQRYHCSTARVSSSPHSCSLLPIPSSRFPSSQLPASVLRRLESACFAPSATYHPSVAPNFASSASKTISDTASRSKLPFSPMRLLTINAGSSSMKIQLYELREEGGDLHLISSKNISNKNEPVHVLQEYVEHENAAASSSTSSDPAPPIRLIAHRIVHGGPNFYQPTVLSEDVLKKLEDLSNLAPLHNPPAMKWIRAAQKAFPHDDVTHVGVFDTGFFHSLPAVAQEYALPRDLVQKHSLRRYGFHGIAHEAMWRSVCQHEPSVPQGGKLITLQLGSGCSVAAIENGKPLDTSFGFGPLEGLIMSTRSGDVDPALIAFLQRTEKSLATGEAIEDLLYHKSGLLALSNGESNDCKELEESQSPGAKLALNVFIYHILKYIGAYTAVLGGLDVLAFGGGIGEHSAFVRRRVVQQLAKYLPMELDEQANNNVKKTGKISTSNSKIQVWVIAVDEGDIMAKNAVDLTQPTGEQIEKAKNFFAQNNKNNNSSSSSQEQK